MARKSKKGSRRATASRPRKKAAPFFADRLLAVVLGLTSCCGVGALSILSAAAFGFSAADSVRADLRKSVSDPAAAWMFDPQAGIAVGVSAGSLAVLFIAVTVGMWRGRRWAHWVNLVWHLAASATGAYFGGFTASLLFPGLIAFYSFARLMSILGPKPS